MKMWNFDKNKLLQGPNWQKKSLWFVSLCAVPTKSWHNLQNVKYYGNTFPVSLHFLLATVRLEQPNHDIDRQNLKWGLHIDMNSIFPDFLVNFKISWWWPIKIYWLFDFNLFLTCGNPATIFCVFAWSFIEVWPCHANTGSSKGFMTIGQ